MLLYTVVGSIIGYVAIHITLRGGRISEKRGKEARGGQR